MENTSGQGAAAPVPAGIDRWNWGAFLLNWIWGIGNNTFIALLMFVPLVNVVMAFVLGAKGSAWAWRNKRWNSVEHFEAVQRKWAIAGGVVLLAVVAGSIALFFAVSASLKSSEAFQLSFARLESNPEAGELLGKPITAGMPTGGVEFSGARGSANFSYSVQGPAGKATAYVKATKDEGAWQIDRMALVQEATGRRVEIGR